MSFALREPSTLLSIVIVISVCCCFVHDPGPGADDAAALPPSPAPALRGV